MPRPFIPILVLVLIAVFALSAGCTLTTPGQPGTTPVVTVIRTATPAVTGTVATTSTPKVTVTVTVSPTATRTATPTTTETTSGGEGGPGSIAGVKWNDLNGDHKRSAGEPVLSGWTIQLDRQEQNGSNWDEVARDVTDANGAYSFTGLAMGHYRVDEVAQTGWTRTFPTNADGMHNLVISNGQPSWTGLDFGNTGGPGASGTATMTTGATATPTAGTTVTTGTATLTTAPTGTGGTVTYYADVLTARNLAFDKASFTVPAGATVAMTFINDDPGVPHNFALYTDSSATTAVFKGAIVTGQQTTLYTFTAPSTAGTYFFRCDVHPTQMTGSFVVI